MQVTALSVNGLPGKVHSFVAKSTVSSKGAGSFTALSVTATPGGIRVFTAKATAEVVVSTGGGIGPRVDGWTEEEELMIMAASAFMRIIG